MSRSETTQPIFAKMIPPKSIRLVSRLREALRWAHDADDEERCPLMYGEPSTQPPDYSSPFSQIEGRDPPTLGSVGVPTQELQPPLSPTFNWLNPTDIMLIGEHPVAAGGSANIWVGVLNGRKIVIKSFRCYKSLDRTKVTSKFNKEFYVCNLLSHRNIVPLVGAWSTGAHPLGLVYEYMLNLDLRQYLRNEPNVRRLILLTGVAQGLDYLHNMGIAHGNLRTTNILVGRDGTVRIAGLGSVSVLSHSKPRWLEGGANSDMSDLSTKSNDMCALGFVAWEIFAGRRPFFDMTEMGANYLMLSGARPPRPDHREVSDRVWDMIGRCWHTVPARRMLVGEVVRLLGSELRRTSDSNARSSRQKPEP